MAKIKSTLTGGGSKSGGVNHQKAYDHMHRSETCVGTVRAGESVHAQTNCVPLSAYVESGSLRESSRYDWKTGKFVKEKMDVMSNARDNMNYLKVRPVTDARQCKAASDDRNGYASCPSPVMGGRGRRY